MRSLGFARDFAVAQPYEPYKLDPPRLAELLDARRANFANSFLCYNKDNHEQEVI